MGFIENKNDINLRVPLKPEFLKVIRLYISGASSIIGFNIDDIEDMKVAVSEVCNILTNKYEGKEININCTLYDDKLEILISFINGKPDNFMMFNNEEDELALAILDALVDESTIIKTDDNNIISLSMTLKEN